MNAAAVKQITENAINWVRSLKEGDKFDGTLNEARRRYSDLHEQQLFAQVAYYHIHQVWTEPDTATIVAIHTA